MFSDEGSNSSCLKVSIVYNGRHETKKNTIWPREGLRENAQYKSFLYQYVSPYASS